MALSRRDQQGWQDHSVDLPLPGRGGAALPPNRHRRQGQDRARRHQGRNRRRAGRVGTSLSGGDRRRSRSCGGPMNVEAQVTSQAGTGDRMGINWIGLGTMVRREVSRMMRVPIQAFVAPWISALLFIFIFGFVVGSRITQIGGHRYLEFVLPGIIMLNVVNAAFLQSSSAIYFSRFVRFIEEILVAPLSYAEMIAGSLSVVVLRASITGVGILVMGLLFGATHIQSWPLFLFWMVSVSAVF